MRDSIPKEVYERFFMKQGSNESLKDFDFFMEEQKRIQDETLKLNPDLKSNLSLFNIYPKKRALMTLNEGGFSPKIKLDKFIVCLTHDVDIIKPTLLFKLFQIKKNPHNLLKKVFINNFKTFKDIVQIEKEFNANSTFFFLMKGKDKSILNYKKVNYDLRREEDIIRYLKNNGKEIGLHGGYWTFNNADRIKKEKRELENIIKERVISYRNHYLRFHIFNTWEYLSNAGFKVDSTFGWNDTLGFRNGWPYPFKPYNFERKKFINIMEFPLNVMDNTLFINNYDLKYSLLIIKNLIKKIKKEKGVLTINWHNNYFNEVFYPGYRKLYKSILKLVKSYDGELLSLREGYDKIKDNL